MLENKGFWMSARRVLMRPSFSGLLYEKSVRKKQVSVQEEQNKVAMVIMAHPDDAEFGCSGTVARWVREGWDVYYVVCTDGGSGGSDDATDVSPEARRQITETRMQEQRNACRILGVKDVIFMGYPDGMLRPTLELRKDIVRLLRQYRPARVICQSPERTWVPELSIPRHHPDHLAAGEATLAALYPASQNPWDFPELLAEGLKPHKVSEIYIVGAPVENHYVDITETFETKLEALRAHTSQVSADFEAIVPMLRYWAASVGKKIGSLYGESFHRVENR
jgi:LmbE family N-acetylglucosaminyl deacetylase